jgi:hypothetical protein
MKQSQATGVLFCHSLLFVSGRSRNRCDVIETSRVCHMLGFLFLINVTVKVQASLLIVDELSAGSDERLGSLRHDHTPLLTDCQN